MPPARSQILGGGGFGLRRQQVPHLPRHRVLNLSLLRQLSKESTLPRPKVNPYSLERVRRSNELIKLTLKSMMCSLTSSPRAEKLRPILATPPPEPESRCAFYSLLCLEKSSATTPSMSPSHSRTECQSPTLGRPLQWRPSVLSPNGNYETPKAAGTKRNSLGRIVMLGRATSPQLLTPPESALGARRMRQRSELCLKGFSDEPTTTKQVIECAREELRCREYPSMIMNGRVQRKSKVYITLPTASAEGASEERFVCKIFS